MQTALVDGRVEAWVNPFCSILLRIALDTLQQCRQAAVQEAVGWDAGGARLPDGGSTMDGHAAAVFSAARESLMARGSMLLRVLAEQGITPSAETAARFVGLAVAAGLPYRVRELGPLLHGIPPAALSQQVNGVLRAVCQRPPQEQLHLQQLARAGSGHVSPAMGVLRALPELVALGVRPSGEALADATAAATAEWLAAHGVAPLANGGGVVGGDPGTAVLDVEDLTPFVYRPGKQRPAGRRQDR